MLVFCYSSCPFCPSSIYINTGNWPENGDGVSVFLTKIKFMYEMPKIERFVKEGLCTFCETSSTLDSYVLLNFFLYRRGLAQVVDA